MLTHVQAHLAAQELTLKRAADDPGKLTKALVEARVDLNPHQVDAALFAFQNPLSHGAILADEVGLGKTIEAGLVATQHWAEGRRRILVLCPASLRTQWRDELQEKFFLPCRILDSKVFKATDATNAFDTVAEGDPVVVIASYHFAARQQEALMTVAWDLAVLDEAHRLRNVYKGAVIGERIKTALATTPKLLLTATPLQNSLLELYGLVSIIDETAFGDQATFGRRYARVGQEGDRFEELKTRLEPLCHRTLRRQVVEYVSYTKREPLTQEFWPTEDEMTLYELVSDYLRRPQLQALPYAQRALITLVLRKLLASSTFAIAGALDTMVRRLKKALREAQAEATSPEEPLSAELIDEELDGLTVTEEASEEPVTPPAVLTSGQQEAMAEEIAELEGFRDLAEQITENAKGDALLTALREAFSRAGELGSARKAVIFTESRRTQEYLVRLLSEHGYNGRIVRFSGTNTDDTAKAIYVDWRQRYAGSDRVTGSRAVDIRAALVDAFRTDAEIMIATEAAAEGINLQFCSIVVNYDLPWNPQRVEQRIGRCHRYGQRNDVVVVNFLNQANAADQRVYELLAEKFQLFEGVFGASDEVLGTIESGVDIERRIADIYQRCRTRDEIDSDFEQLRLDFADDIDTQMKQTRTLLLEHFDAQVHDRLKVRLDQSQMAMDRHQDLLTRVMRYSLGDRAAFDGNGGLTVVQMPPGVPLEAPRRYSAHRPDDESAVHHLRPADPLAHWALGVALERPDEGLELTFAYSGWEVTAVDLEPLSGAAGVMRAVKLTITGKEDEEHLLVAAMTDEGFVLSDDQVSRLLLVPAAAAQGVSGPLSPEIDARLGTLQQERLDRFGERKAEWLGGEYDKLDRWASDERDRLLGDVRDAERQLAELKKQIRQAGTEPARLPLRRRQLELDRQLDTARREYDGAAVSIDERRGEMLDRIEGALASEHAAETLFTIRWSVT